MNRTVSFGLVGWTRASGQLVKRLADLPQAELRWLCDPPSELKLGPLAHRLGARRTFDPDVMFDDEHVDAIIICAPYAQRMPLVERGLESEKDVFVLGPVAATGVEAERLLTFAATRKRVLDATTPFLRDGALVDLTTRLAAGELGELYYVAADCSVADDVGEGVDILSELAADDIAALLHLTHDRPVEVDASIEAYGAEERADVLACIFRFATGVTARMTYSRVDASPRHTLRLVGSDATAVLNRHQSDHRLLIHYRAGLDARHSLSVRVPEVDPYLALCEQFLTAVRTRSRQGSAGEIDAVAETIEAVSACLARRSLVDAHELPSQRAKSQSRGGLENARVAHL